MILEFIEYLRKSPEAGAISIWRDDDELPFSDLSSTPVLIRQSSSQVDRDISVYIYDVWLFSPANATNSDAGQVENRANILQDWLTMSRDYTGRIYGVSVINGVSGPFKDGQNRWSFSINVQVRRGLGK